MSVEEREQFEALVMEDNKGDIDVVTNPVFTKVYHTREIAAPVMSECHLGSGIDDILLRDDSPQIMKCL